MNENDENAKALIEKGEWVDCWICRDAFQRGKLLDTLSST